VFVDADTEKNICPKILEILQIMTEQVGIQSMNHNLACEILLGDSKRANTPVPLKDVFNAREAGNMKGAFCHRNLL